MAAYVIAEVKVTDTKLYDEYKKLVPATVAKYGGQFAVRGGAVECARNSAQGRQHEADPG